MESFIIRVAVALIIGTLAMAVLLAYGHGDAATFAFPVAGILVALWPSGGKE